MFKSVCMWEAVVEFLLQDHFTLPSLFINQKENEFLTGHKRASLFNPPSSSAPCFCCAPSFSFFPYLSSLIIFLFLCFFLWKRYFSTNDLIRGVIWNSIMEDFLVATTVWMEGGGDANVYFLWPLTSLRLITWFG